MIKLGKTWINPAHVIKVIDAIEGYNCFEVVLTTKDTMTFCAAVFERDIHVEFCDFIAAMNKYLKYKA